MRQEMPLIVKSETVAKLKMFLDLKLKHEPDTNANTSPAFCNKKCRSEHQMLFPLFRGSWDETSLSAYPIVSVTLPPCGKTKALHRVITHTVIRIRPMAFINVTVN